MEQSPTKQIIELISKSQKILVVTRRLPNGDSIGSMLALGLVLEKMGKEINLVCHGPISSTLSFLPKHNAIQNDLKPNNSFIIKLDTSKAKVAQFSYDFDEDGHSLNIYVTPEDGKYDASHVSTNPGNTEYDLIFIVDCPDLELLGPVYHNSAELFYNTPIVNIDHDSANEQYGEVNLVDMTASSTAEVLYSLLESFDKKYFDRNVATCLLAGIIDGTRSFQSPETTPKSFTIAAQLVAAGGDQQKIVRSIFKMKDLATLKLWGRVLARVNEDSEHKIAWSMINGEDFSATSANPENLEGVIDELMMSMEQVEIAFILFKNNNKVYGIVKGVKSINMKELARPFRSSPEDGIVRIAIETKDLAVAEKKVLEIIRKFQKDRQGK